MSTINISSIGSNKFLIISWFIQKKTADFFKKVLGNSLQEVCVKNYDIELRVNSNNIYPILYFLRKHTICQYDCLIDLVCYDTPGKNLRFGIIYNLLSVQYNTRIRVVSKFKSVTTLLSVTSIFFGAN